MNELMARSLSPTEIAEEYRYHDDAGVRALSSSVRGEVQDEEEYQEEIDRLERVNADLEETNSGLEVRNEDLAELLEECITTLPDAEGELISRIQAALK